MNTLLEERRDNLGKTVGELAGVARNNEEVSTGAIPGKSRSGDFLTDAAGRNDVSRSFPAAGSNRPPSGDRSHEWSATWDRGYTCTMCGRAVAAAHRTTGRCVSCTLEVER